MSFVFYSLYIEAGRYLPLDSVHTYFFLLCSCWVLVWPTYRITYFSVSLVRIGGESMAGATATREKARKVAPAHHKTLLLRWTERERHTSTYSWMSTPPCIIPISVFWRWGSLVAYCSRRPRYMYLPTCMYLLPTHRYTCVWLRIASSACACLPAPAYIATVIIVRSLVRPFVCLFV
jgi:hypothetical protein